MDIIKIVLVLFSLWTINVDAYPSVVRKPQKRNRSKPLLGKDILKRKLCFDNEACDNGYSCDMDIHRCIKDTCTNRRDCAPGLVCNTNTWSCEEPTKTEQIINKQACPNIIKNTCFSDSQCTCEGGDYVCEKDEGKRQGECVKRKLFVHRKDGEKCTSNKQCQFPSSCTDGICMPDKDIIALLMSLTFSTSDDDNTMTKKDVYKINSWNSKRRWGRWRNQKDYARQSLTNEIEAASN